MKSFKDFLLEYNVGDFGAINDGEDWATRVLNNCQPIIQEVGGIQNYSLFRGMDQSALFYYAPTRKDRESRDTREEIHHAMDQWFEENFGIKYRSNAIIATGGLGQSKIYGTPYMIFPEGQIKYLWSDQLRDIGAGIESRVHQTTLRHRKSPPTYKVILNGTKRVMDQITWQTNDLHQMMGDEREVMISAPAYYAANVKHIDENRVKQLLLRAQHAANKQ